MSVKDKKRSCVSAPIYCFPEFQMLQSITAAVTRDNWNNFISCAGIWVCKWTRVSCQQNFKGKFKMAISVARHLRESVPPPPRSATRIYVSCIYVCLCKPTVYFPVLCFSLVGCTQSTAKHFIAYNTVKLYVTLTTSKIGPRFTQRRLCGKAKAAHMVMWFDERQFILTVRRFDLIKTHVCAVQ